jgi:predicted carbohydrate-binding protein with CBM5 and CBM33 domain
MSSPIHIPRSLVRVCTVAAAALLLLATLLVDSASAHGSTIDPASRNYGCWKRWGNDFQNPTMATVDPMCWQAWQADTNAMWNWNGLYRENVQGNHQAAVPNGTLCSAGNTSGGRYSALDNPGNWTATTIANPAAFTVVAHDQARHGAKYFRVYISRQGFNPVTQRLAWSDLVLLKDTGPVAPGAGETTSDPVLNGVSVKIPVSAPGMTGRHLVYTVWEAGHADQVYYWCADVAFR